ncbi:MAG: hypothetical protein KC493_15625 [Bacteriovoracaceae bacterium]|nr:hypothetical protein [Bacteriovoracaceae bacterium]
MELGKVILYSKNKEKLAQLMSEVFDGDILPVDNGIGIDGENIKLLLLDHPKRSLVPSSILDFYLDTKEELLELENKLNFYSYRHGQDLGITYEKIENEDLSYLLIKDFDNREWKFSTKVQ